MSLQFSVITPSFQQGRFIERTIKSVLSQNIPDIEYVICDGGSTDETIEIIKRYEDRIKWISEPDQGQADAVNRGIAMTNGDIIAWINSDDIYYPNTFKIVQEIFINNPEVQIIYGAADHIDEHDQFIEDYPTEYWNYQRLMETCYICQPAVFFRRSMLEKFGLLDVSLNYCMDYELWLRYGKYVSFYYIPQKLAGSRLYNQNKTLGQRELVYREIQKMLQNKFGKIPDTWLWVYARYKIDKIIHVKIPICLKNNQIMIKLCSKIYGKF